MDFDPNAFFLEFIFSSIGAVLFIYGKKQHRWPQMAAGVLFTVYPYFVSGVTMILVVGVALAIGLWWVVRIGY